MEYIVSLMCDFVKIYFTFTEETVRILMEPKWRIRNLWNLRTI